MIALSSKPTLPTSTSTLNRAPPMSPLSRYLDFCAEYSCLSEFAKFFFCCFSDEIANGDSSFDDRFMWRLFLCWLVFVEVILCCILVLLKNYMALNLFSVSRVWGHLSADIRISEEGTIFLCENHKLTYLIF